MKFVYCILFSLISVVQILPSELPKLFIAPNNRYLIKKDGAPFVWIGDTNWFFAKLPPSTIDKILDKRSKQGFTIMLVSCREKLYNGDGPGNISKPNENWWLYLDEYIKKCEQRGLYVGLALGWWGITRKNNERNLYQFGKWVGNRYKDQNNIVWLTLGEAGSHSRKDTIPSKKIYALVKGIREGDTGNKLLTIHADYGRGTSITNDGYICDFNNWQSSQRCCPTDLPRKDNETWTVWEAIEFDYNKRYNGRPKPTLDCEAWYENNKDFCGALPFHIRRRAYFTILAGAFGYTYGAGGIWDALNNEQGCSKNALEALNYPGAKDISHLGDFFHSLGDKFLELRPDQEIIVSKNSQNYDFHIQASISTNKRLAIIYSASDRKYKIDINKIYNKYLSAMWFNPRSNEYQSFSPIEIISQKHIFEFDPPGEFGSGYDWILILESKS